MRKRKARSSNAPPSLKSGAREEAPVSLSTPTPTPPSSRSSMRPPLDPGDPLSVALHAAEDAPTDEARWDEAEGLASSLERPEEVADAQRRALLAMSAAQAEDAAALGERAARFHDEWFDDPDALAELLGLVLERSPSSRWAFDRLVMQLTVGSRFQELLALYDRAIATETDATRVAQLLDDAAHAAKDFAGDADRAIGYLAKLLALKPSDARLAMALERLYEKQSRFRELIELWTSRVPLLPRGGALALRAKIAACWLDRLGDAPQALQVSRGLLQDDPHDLSICRLLERLAAAPGVATETRASALTLLKDRYAAAKRSEDVVRVLRLALETDARDEKIGVHRELADRLVELGRPAEAIEHAAAIVVLEPSSTEARDRLRQLADASAAHARRVEALETAVGHAGDARTRLSLLVEAAHVAAEAASDAPRAIDLYARALATEGLAAGDEHDDASLLEVARQLSGLLARAGRRAEELEVLVRRAALEHAGEPRAAVLGEAARLAAELGDRERSLALWTERLGGAADDVEALDAIIEQLEAMERWPALLDALRKRAAVVPAGRRRADLVRIAAVQAERVGAVADAIATWFSVIEEFGRDAAAVDALDALYTRDGRFDELEVLLASAAEREPDDAIRAARLRRLGDVLRGPRADRAGATFAYRDALRAWPGDTGARDGLLSIVKDGPSADAAIAVESLSAAFAATDEWRSTLEIVDARLENAGLDARRVAILLEAAKLHEQRGEDLRSALRALRRAFPYAPADGAIEEEIARLSTSTEEHAIAVDAFREAVGRLEAAEPVDEARVVHLRARAAELLERHLGDFSSALSTLAPAVERAPTATTVVESMARVAARAGQWASAAHAIVRSARALERVEEGPIATAESIAKESDAIGALATALTEELGATPPDAVSARELWVRVALWHRDLRRDDDAAEATLVRAVEAEPSHAETLRLLAVLQRRAPGRALFDTLLRLAQATRSDLGVLFEAAGVALDDLDDRRLAANVLERLLQAAGDRWTAPHSLPTLPPISAPPHPSGDFTQSLSAESLTAWALGKLVEIHLADGDAARAAELLVESSRLPFAPETARDMRHRAAMIRSDNGDARGAIELYREVLAEAPGDARAVAALAALYEREGSLAELAQLRREELALTADVDRRLAIRLELAGVLGRLPSNDERVEVLLENLGEQPGHAASIDAIDDVLTALGRHAQLANVLTEQALRLETAGSAHAAAALWTRIAQLSESPLKDVARALESHGRVVSLAPTLETFDALARLHAARGELDQAIGWLTRRLAETPAGARAATVVSLAEKQIARGTRDEALVALESGLAEEPSARPLRALLAKLHREAESWEPLARVLEGGASAEHAGSDVATRVAYLREAADVRLHHLQDAEGAVALLDSAAALAPNDRALRTVFAEALRLGGRLDDAQKLLDALVEEYGRRRPPERAVVHVQLAEIARARGDLAGALAQLETASSVDMGQPLTLQRLATLAHEGGDLERAERAYRALHVIVRRPSAVVGEVLGPSEVLFRLHRIASALGQEDRARETLESAFEAAAESDEEATRLSRALRAAGEHELLLRALSARLSFGEGGEAAAKIHGEMAELYESLGRLDEAFDARVRALEGEPAGSPQFEASRALARKAGKLARYAELLGGIARQAEDRGAADDQAGLLLLLGAIAEEDLGDLAHARAAYAQAFATGERQAASLRALERVTSALGDDEGRLRALRAIAQLDGESEAEWKTESAYRFAELATAEGRDEATRDDGLEVLANALDRDPQLERAATLLQRVRGSAKAAALYEFAARGLGDATLLLDALERTAALPEPSTDTLREAVDLANVLGEDARAEALLARAIEVARSEGRPAEAVWAHVAVASRRKTSGALREAVDALLSAASAAEHNDASESFQLSLDAAQTASAAGDLARAAEIYERLLARDPADRNVWAPLLEAYRKLGEKTKLDALIASTVESVFDAAERNLLYLERARLLRAEPDRREDAIASLREILDSEPENVEAASLLVDIYEEAGRTEELADLLSRRLDFARERGDEERIVELSLRLAGLLEGSRREDALDVLRGAAASAPARPELLRAMIRLFRTEDDPVDRADVIERLLGFERGETAAVLAVDLAKIREQLGDEDGVERALDAGFRAFPAGDKLRVRLEKWHESHESFGKLIDVIAFDADARAERGDVKTALSRLREGAAVAREKLNDPSQSLELLRKARGLAPEDLALLQEVVSTLSELGRQSEAVEELGAALEGDVKGAARAGLLSQRASLALAAGDPNAAVADLEAALELQGAAVRPALLEALEQQRRAAQGRANEATERAATLRLCALAEASGQADRAIASLSEWIERAPSDVEALTLLAKIAVASQSWTSAAEALHRLVIAQPPGDGQIDAALRLVEACAHGGFLESARDALEYAASQNPTAAKLRVELRRVYEAAGAFRELGELCMADAAQAETDAARFDALVAAGQWYVRAGDGVSLAIEPLAQAARLRPTSIDVVCLLADAYTASGRVDEAIEVLTPAINAQKGRRSREVSALQHRMARAANAGGGRDVEMQWLLKALESDMQNGEVASELADVAMELQQYDVALKALKAVTLLKNPGPMSRALATLRQGQIAYYQGDAKRAAYLAKKALSDDPSLGEAETFLREIGG
jgi:tetratricopeptide (TPR) repeat protein